MYPFISYGSDWLGFAHLMIAVVFLGPLQDPVRNRWVIEFGIICCIAIFPFAFIAGAIRGIPFFWRLIDCSFGIAGGLILLSCYKKIDQLEKMKLLKI
jgi:small neutral amino acid transporter SnatA (MarC family)